MLAYQKLSTTTSKALLPQFSGGAFVASVTAELARDGRFTTAKRNVHRGVGRDAGGSRPLVRWRKVFAELRLDFVLCQNSS